MRALQDYEKLVQELENGPKDTQRIQALVQEICSTPWSSGEERQRAQGLVLRLERLLR